MKHKYEVYIVDYDQYGSEAEHWQFFRRMVSVLTLSAVAAGTYIQRYMTMRNLYRIRLMGWRTQKFTIPITLNGNSRKLQEKHN